MLQMAWPIALIVLSNIFYHICSKSLPSDVNPFASLTITYSIGAVCSVLLYFATNRGGSLLEEFHRVNWSSFVLGLSIVGLEAGCIYMYKAGWNINTGQLVYSSLLTICLLLVGYFLYHEAITPTKVLGILICMVGLYVINR